MFLYLITSRVPMDFRLFLLRHSEVLRPLVGWTIRVLVPAPLTKAIRMFGHAAREELATPIAPATAEGLEPGLTGRLVPSHHAFESRAVLGVVHALRIAFVELRPRIGTPTRLPRWGPRRNAAFGHGQRLRAAHELGNYVMAGTRARATISGATMSVKVTYTNGVFVPLEQAKSMSPGRRYTVFSDEELAEIRETLAWLVAAEKSFEFWNSPADAIFDTL